MKLRLALRETLHNWRFSAAFLLNLGLGFFGFILLSTLQNSIDDTFQSRSKALMTADLSISAQRVLTPQEEETIQSALDSPQISESTVSQVLETYSMMATSTVNSSRLVELVAIQANYPLYGELRLKPSGLIRGTSKKNVNSDLSIWISPELALQMKLNVGDPVKIGNATFTISDVIEEDSGMSWRGASLAPRVYIGWNQFAQTELKKKGSRINYRRYYKFKDDAATQTVAKELERRLTDPEIRVSTHQDAGEQTGRVLTYLGDFLGLVALVGLFMAALGGAYLFQSFLSRRIGAIATLRSLGLSTTGTISVYLIQVALLGTAAVTTAFLLAALTLPMMVKVLEQHLAFAIAPTLSLQDFLRLLLVGVIGGVLTCLPFLLKLRGLRLGLLFQESYQPHLELGSPSLLSLIPAAVFFYSLSIWQAHSWKIGSFFFLGFVGSGIILVLVILGAFKLPGVSEVRSLRYLTRNKLSCVSAFLAVGLGAVLMNLLPQLQQNIESEIGQPESSSLPSLFLFDIQDEQAEGIRQLMANENIPLSPLSPMVRARLESVNGAEFLKSDEAAQASTREEEQSARARNRGYNLTYRAELSPAERIIDGKFYSGMVAPGGVAELSVETRFAERLKLKLGDTLVFDVQGTRVPGKITSIRQVKWTSFQPNFFIAFQPGALEDAPKTYLGTVLRLSLEERARIQNLVVSRFPNVSVVDVTNVMKKLLGIFEQMALALRAMAGLSILTGLVVLFSIASQQARVRRSEVQLLKVLGASQSYVSKMFLIEFGSIGLAASLLGVMLSLLLSYAISVLFFDSAWSFSLQTPLSTVLAITLMTIGTTQLAVRRTLRERPAALLAELS